MRSGIISAFTSVISCWDFKVFQMDTLWVTWIWAGLIIFAASLIQSVIGFGFALISTPLFLTCGLSLPEAIALTMASSLIQRIFFTWKLRAHTPPMRKMLPVIIGTVLFLWPGLLVLGLISGQSRDVIRQFVGGLIVAMVLFQQFARVKPRDHLHAGWGLLAGSGSGFLSGLMNIGGPPVILWTYAHRWRQEMLRICAISMSLFVFPFQIALFTGKFGATVAVPLLAGVLSTPLAFLGTKLGLAIGRRFHTALLRTVVMIILVLMGLSYMLSSLFR